ncbi:MAG: class I SAM-dependent methyltransferase [Deltaproteobacteria bacterium]|nr:class I SAM-dependent methyltransferase [Deltaproteobacteria bacterium]
MTQPLSGDPVDCPSCQSELRESLINDNYLACPFCESLFRKKEGSISPQEACLEESYRDRAITILNNDKHHYEYLYCNPFIVEKFRIPLLNRDWILALGGGHPKLEAYLQPKRIEACDLFPEVYLKTMEEFRSVYDYSGEVQYHRVSIDASFRPPTPSDSTNGLISLVHFLEHLEYEESIRVLKNLPSHTDVVIYGPNAGKKPMPGDWIHLRPQDHLTLVTLKRLKQILSDMKYEIKYDTAFADDMLIYFNTAGGRTMSGTSCVRDRVERYIQGVGIDIGYGGDSISKTSINIDLPHPYTSVGSDPQHLSGDARSLHWFADNVMDYVYSSHLLEDFENMGPVLDEWLRVLRQGGNLILNLPDEKKYRAHCRAIGEPPNEHHSHEDLTPDIMMNLLEGKTETVYVERFDPYSFVMVARKL